MDWDLMKIIGSVFGVVGLFLVLIANIVFGLSYLFDNVPVRITVDGKEVYHGRSACVSTESIGSSSRVDVKTGPWCMFPKEYFSGKNVVITTEEKHG